MTGLLVLQAFIGFVSLGLLVWELGWPVSLSESLWFEGITWSLVAAALIAEAGLAWKERRISRLKKAIILSALVLLAARRFGLDRPLRDWLDALFTSTSAVCVTGLGVVDTEHAFTTQGQVIILLLIQIGGRGIMTLTYFMALVVGQGISLRDRARLRELFSDDNLGAMGRLVGRVVLIILAIEAAGAVLLCLSWSANPPREGRLRWDAVFHSVSAFCNAGFSTFSSSSPRRSAGSGSRARLSSPTG